MKTTQDHINKSLSKYLNNFKEYLSKPQFNHFQSKIISILNNKPHGSETARFYSGKHETSETRFLTQSPWDAETLTDLRISHAFQVLNQTYHKYVLVVVDDSTSEREYAEELPGIQYHHSDEDDRDYVKGQTIVTTQLVVGDRDFPLYADIYDKNVEGQTKIDLANRQVKRAISLIKPLLKRNQQIKVTVDSWYNGEPFLSPILSQNLHVVAPLKTNRNVKKHGKWMKIADIADTISKQKFKHLKVKGTHYRFIKITGGIKGYGNEKFTILVNQHLQQKEDGSFKWSSVKFLLSTDPSLSAYSIFYIYQRRWKIETFYQFAKYELGIDKSRSFSKRALLRFFLLVYFAFTYLCLAGYELTPLQICDGSYYEVRNTVLRLNRRQLISWVYIQGQEGRPYEEILLEAGFMKKIA